MGELLCSSMQMHRADPDLETKSLASSHTQAFSFFYQGQEGKHAWSRSGKHRLKVVKAAKSRVQRVHLISLDFLLTLKFSPRLWEFSFIHPHAALYLQTALLLHTHTHL